MNDDFLVGEELPPFVVMTEEAWLAISENDRDSLKSAPGITIHHYCGKVRVSGYSLTFHTPTQAEKDQRIMSMTLVLPPGILDTQ